MSETKMSLNEEIPLSIEEVERALTEIDNKYSPINSTRSEPGKDSFDDTLAILSKEFDSLGLPPIDCSQSIAKIFKQVVSEAHSLVQIHRRTLSQMKDVNIDNRYKDSKSTDLYKTIDDYKLKLTKHGEKNTHLQSKLLKLTHDRDEVVKREHTLKEELEKTKRYYTSKQNELHHHIKRLTKENGQLKEKLGKDINTRTSKDDVVLKLIKQYKGNEEIYKSTIQKLQENNRELLNEILDLKEENDAVLVDKKQKCT